MWKERHGKKNSLAKACTKVSFCDYYDELAAEYGRVASCHELKKKMAVIKECETQE